MHKASCQMQRRLSICDCSTSKQPAVSARLQLHLQAPGKTCLSPSEASSAGQTDPIDSTRTRLGSTRLDLIESS